MSADERVQFTFEGRDIEAAPGMSLAAALAAAGEYELRSVDGDECRGVFCGIGVCQECVVEVAGRGRVRACMTGVEAAMAVTRSGRLATVGGVDAAAGRPAPEVIEPDVLIIGGGAAGLTAAASLAGSDVDVVVVDERSAAGGQYYKQPITPERLHPSLADDVQIHDGAALLERARNSGARFLAKAEIWGAFAAQEFVAGVDGATTHIRPKRTIVAAGAYERGLPLPGWTLPGVMTSGAAQTMLKSNGEIPGHRVLVCGNGPLNIQIATELSRAGAEVVAVTELAPSPYTRVAAAMGMVASDPALSLLGLGSLRSLRGRGIRMLFGHGLHSVERSGSGLKAWVGRFDGSLVERDLDFDVDIVCTGFGFQPNNEILRSLECGHSFDQAGGQLTVIRNDDCETSVSGVYAIGDCCGLGGAPAAREEGVIAAAAVLRSLNENVPATLAAEEVQARKRLRKHRRFQRALWQMFTAPRPQSGLADDTTIICRCESVRLTDVRNAISAGDISIGALKRRTRLGMGACQGRYCAPVAASMLAEHTGQTINEYSFFAPRVPFKPTPISSIVGMASDDRDEHHGDGDRHQDANE
jgi:thioredoxin reductase/bacterioferritin-associated ferredoxin